MLYRIVKGVSIPALGLGTFGLSGAEGLRAVRAALDCGYRHIDTAQRYGNEDLLGEALATTARESLFVTTKIWHTDLAPDGIPGLVEASLRRLRSDYLDLLLVHWPNPAIPLKGTLDAMRGVAAAGRVRHLGVSNFPVALLEEATAHGGEALLTNQVEYHPLLDQSRMLDWLGARGMALTAYMPLARGRLAHEPVLQAIAGRHGRSLPQVVLRWLVQQDGVIAIPRSSRPDNLKANLDIFDFVLSPDEMARIDGLRGPTRLANPAFAPHWDPV